jgi:dipeptidase E
MKILLSSNSAFFCNNFQEVFNISVKDVKLAYVTTAVKGVEDKNYIKTNCLKMKEMGLDFTEVDIDSKNEEELEILLRDFNFIRVAGGNPFYLLKSVKESGFDKVIKKLISQGVIYAGSSAGAYIACPNIDMALWKEECRGQRHKHYGITDYEAMGLVDFLVMVHYEDDLKNVIKKKLLNLEYSLRILKDDQALLIENDQVKFIGKEKEEIIN